MMPEGNKRSLFKEVRGDSDTPYEPKVEAPKVRYRRPKSNRNWWLDYIEEDT